MLFLIGAKEGRLTFVGVHNRQRLIKVGSFKKMITCFSAFLKFDSIFGKFLSGSKILYFQRTIRKYVSLPYNYSNEFFDKCLIVIIYSSLSLYLFSNFIVYFLCLCCFFIILQMIRSLKGNQRSYREQNRRNSASKKFKGNSSMSWHWLPSVAVLKPLDRNSVPQRWLSSAAALECG